MSGATWFARVILFSETNNTIVKTGEVVGKSSQLKLAYRAHIQRRFWDFTEKLELLIAEYRSKGRAIEVDFRSLVHLGAGIDRYTHLIHPYPAKLLLNIPLFFLNSSQMCPPEGMVYDPFCGSGTVLLEAILSGRPCIGSDSNPLARQIAHAKTTWVDPKELLQAIEHVLKFEGTAALFTPVMDPTRWYSDDHQLQLGRLLSAIRTVCAGAIRAFMEVCFSACVKRLSAADPRLSVPVRLKGEALARHLEGLPNARELFLRIATQNVSRIEKLPQGCTPGSIFNDVREPLNQGAGPDVDLVLTSPPYAGAQKYIRASSLSLGWLGLAPDAKLRNLERLNIGREHFAQTELRDIGIDARIGADDILEEIRSANPLRAHIAGKYLEEMEHAADAIVARMKPGAKLVLIVGDNQVCGKSFTTTKFLQRIFEIRGLHTKLELVDTIKSRGLMTKRNRTAGTIEREHVYILAKQRGEI